MVRKPSMAPTNGRPDYPTTYMKVQRAGRPRPWDWLRYTTEAGCEMELKTIQIHEHEIETNIADLALLNHRLQCDESNTRMSSVAKVRQ